MYGLSGATTGQMYNASTTRHAANNAMAPKRTGGNGGTPGGLRVIIRGRRRAARLQGVGHGHRGTLGTLDRRGS
jgi:hypothetical protein